MSCHFKTMNTLIALSLISLVLLITACDRKGKNIPTYPPTADSRLSEGWTAFESGDYEQAINGFTDAKNRDAAYADAYNGLAWSYARTQDFDNAKSNFSVFMSLVGEDMSKRIDAYAGLATIYAANQEDSLAIEWSKEVLNIEPNYEFNHDAKVNAKSLKALVAKSYFNMQK